jgi:hypothetical protein
MRKIVCLVIVFFGMQLQVAYPQSCHYQHKWNELVIKRRLSNANAQTVNSRPSNSGYCLKSIVEQINQEQRAINDDADQFPFFFAPILLHHYQM